MSLVCIIGESLKMYIYNMSLKKSMLSNEITGTESADMKRFAIRLPSWHMKRLIWWAAIKKQSLAGMAQNTLQARIEVNAPQIEEMLIELARDEGISVNELKQRLLAEANYSSSSDVDEVGGV